MAVNAIPVDQRVIDIDSRRFASIEKALVELITNADDSYARLERAGVAVTGCVRVQYERHRHGALLTVADQAEGLPFDKACAILSYGGAHSLLAQGMAGGRGYFGRGLKQAIFGLGSGWLETIRDGRLARIELFPRRGWRLSLRRRRPRSRGDRCRPRAPGHPRKRHPGGDRRRQPAGQHLAVRRAGACARQQHLPA
jgi:hypothetical protein